MFKNCLFAFLFLSGCALASPFIEKPKIELKKVDFTDTSLSDTTLIFNFLVENPNSYSLKVDKIDYTVNLNNKPFTEGVLDSPISIEGKGTAVVNLPVKVKFSDVFASVADVLRNGSTPYEVHGYIRSGYLIVPFFDSGDVKLSDLKK